MNQPTQQYAGFWLRVVAALIDIVIFTVVITIPLSFIYGTEEFAGSATLNLYDSGELFVHGAGEFIGSERSIHGFWDFIFSIVLPFIAAIYFWRRFLGTPGKMVLRLRIVDASSGDRMSVRQAIGRFFAYAVSVLPLFLGVAWVGVDKRKQGWHDKLANTVVVRDLRPEEVKFEQRATREPKTV